MTKINLQLPGSIISEEDWNVLLEHFENAEDVLSVEFKKWFYDECKRLKKKYCIGKNEEKCLICGNSPIDTKGLCITCAGAYRDRGVLRMQGKVHGSTIKKIPCKICGEPSFSKGLCRSCYYKKKYYGFETDEEFKAHEEKVGNIRPEGLYRLREVKW